MCGQPSKLVILPLTLFTPETSDRFDEGHLLPWPGLTATVTATAATAGKRQRPATVRNTRTIRANWGYVRPEKRKVGAAIGPLAALARIDTARSAWENHTPVVLQRGEQTWRPLQ